MICQCQDSRTANAKAMPDLVLDRIPGYLWVAKVLQLCLQVFAHQRTRAEQAEADCKSPFEYYLCDADHAFYLQGINNHHLS